MRRLTIIGTSALALGLLGAVLNYSAREAFPAQWGGANIGGGILQLLCYAAIGAGALLAAIGLVIGAGAGRGAGDGRRGPRGDPD